MPTPFNLDHHPRRPQPLSAPPAGYFDQLPTRVMARLPQPQPAASWLHGLAPAWRTALASSALLSGFGMAFWLGLAQPTVPPVAAARGLDAVPRAALTEYLLTSEARVDNADLAQLVAGRPELTQGFLQASAEELRQAEEAQAEEDLYF